MTAFDLGAYVRRQVLEELRGLLCCPDDTYDVVADRIAELEEPNA